MSKKKTQGLSAAELSLFCGQVALILEAGLPLYDGMETLAGTEAADRNAALYQAVSRKVTETGSLYEALKDDESWPVYLREMVGIGEQSGQLDRVLRGLERYYAREERLKSAISSAVTYPLVLGALLVAIVLILLWRLLPVFRRVMAGMGVGLNDTGSRLMNAGAAVGWIVLALVVVALAVTVAVVLGLKSKRREAVMERLRKAVPAIGRLQDRLSASRIAEILSMMLSSGFPLQEALEMTNRALTDRGASEKLAKVREGLDRGDSFSDAVEKAEIFDPLHSRMLTMGSATGTESQVLEKLAAIYEESAEEGLERTVSIIEPTLVAVLAVVIGAVLLAVLLPMAGILSSL